MLHGKWTYRPTPRRKSLQQVVAERRKQRSKQWHWLQKQVAVLFVRYTDPSQYEEVEEKRQR